ncbi:hypothetical protein ACWGJ2_12750 [Streptomyces sp. NPDC054796]
MAHTPQIRPEANEPSEAGGLVGWTTPSARRPTSLQGGGTSVEPDVTEALTDANDGPRTHGPRTREGAAGPAP